MTGAGDAGIEAGVRAGLAADVDGEVGRAGVDDERACGELVADVGEPRERGLDHERLTFKFQGLDQRLTGVENPKVVKQVLPKMTK